MKRFLTLFLLSAVLFQVSCTKDDDLSMGGDHPKLIDGKLAQQWFKLECTIVKETPGMFPPQAARAFGYTGLALYETVVQGWPEAKSLAGQISGLNAGMLPLANTDQYSYDWGIASNAALADIMRKMFEIKITPANLAAINALEKLWKDDLSNALEPAVVERSEAFGKAMATAIYAYSASDGGHQSQIDPFQLPFTLPTNNGAWIPTSAALNPLAPKWAQNRAFVFDNIAEAQPAPHIPFDTDPTSDFYQAAMDVYTIVTNATEEQKDIAKFWADDPFNTCTPTGHTFNILTQLLEETNANLAKSAVAYAKLGLAENDAFICCWKTKYDHFLIRPVSYIKQHIDPAFATVIGTPPFPAFTSGHATEAAAGSQVFVEMFTNGDGNYDFTDRTQIQFGFPIRTYTNFNQMAEECADSRLFGGIHYDMDNQIGLTMGRIVGQNVITKLDWPTSF